MHRTAFALSILLLALGCSSEDTGSATACTRTPAADKECTGFGTTKGLQVSWSCSREAAGNEKWLWAKDAGGKGCVNESTDTTADPMFVCCPP